MLQTTKELVRKYITTTEGQVVTTASIAHAVGRSHAGVAVALSVLRHEGAIEIVERRPGPGGGTIYAVIGGAQ